MVKTGVMRKSEAWDEIFQLKLKHLDRQISNVQKITYGALVFLGAFFFSLLNLSPYLIEKIGLKTLGLLLIVLLMLSALYTIIVKTLDKRTKQEYNHLYYEVFSGKMEDIESISMDKYHQYTSHRK